MEIGRQFGCPQNIENGHNSIFWMVKGAKPGEISVSSNFILKRERKWPDKWNPRGGFSVIYQFLEIKV